MKKSISDAGRARKIMVGHFADYSVPIAITNLIEGKNIWLITYNAKEYVENNNPHAALLGNSPFLLDKNTHEIISVPWDSIYEFILNYKQKKAYPTNTSFMEFLLDEIQKVE